VHQSLTSGHVPGTIHSQSGSTVLRVLEALKLPSVALYAVETTLKCGFESHSLRLGREADSPRNITADLFRAEQIISRRTIRAEVVHLRTKFGPLELPLNEEQIPQIVEKQ
jgi:hypothetical protein